MKNITISTLIKKPLSVEKNLTLKDGEPVAFRPLVKDDSDAFGVFLDGLSQETRKRYGPHPINSTEARNICNNLDYSDRLPLVLLNSQREIIGYIIMSSKFRDDEMFRYQQYGLPVVQGRDVRIAPVVADRYQNNGVGSLMLRKTINLAMALDAKRMILWMGTQATNDRAVHFYEKMGFKKVGEFFKYEVNNYDMYLDL